MQKTVKESSDCDQSWVGKIYGKDMFILWCGWVMDSESADNELRWKWQSEAGNWFQTYIRMSDQWFSLRGASWIRYECYQKKVKERFSYACHWVQWLWEPCVWGKVACNHLSQCRDFRASVMSQDLGALTTAWASESWMCLIRVSGAS